MKQVLLIRHAKSSWKDLELQDYERPLNKRGRIDAPFMAEKLKEKKVRLDRVLSSGATRAIATAKIISKELGVLDRVERDDELYHIEADEIEEYIRNQNSGDNIAIVAHNPGLTDFVNMFFGYEIENIPTAGVVSILFEVEEWEEAGKGNAILDYFIYPKMYQK